MIQAQVSRYMSVFWTQNGGGSQGKNDVNLIHKSQEEARLFDGHYSFSIMPSTEQNVWIIDSRASTYICSNPELLTTTFQLKKTSKNSLTRWIFEVNNLWRSSKTEQGYNSFRSSFCARVYS